MTLGCKVNQFETETIEGLFHRAGYRTVPFGEAADVCVINTCSVTALGEKKSRQIIRRARRENENALIVATGCYAQLSPQELAKLDGVRLVVGTQDRARIVELVDGKAEFYSNTSDEFKKLLAFKGIPYDVLKAAAVEVAVVRVVPYRFEMYDTDFVKQGYDVRQIVDR